MVAQSPSKLSMSLVVPQMTKIVAVTIDGKKLCHFFVAGHLHYGERERASWSCPCSPTALDRYSWKKGTKPAYHQEFLCRCMPWIKGISGVCRIGPLKPLKHLPRFFHLQRPMLGIPWQQIPWMHASCWFHPDSGCLMLLHLAIPWTNMLRPEQILYIFLVISWEWFD